MDKLSILLSDVGTGPLTLGEKTSLSLTTLLLGMAVVFSVLLIIMIVILIVGKIFQSIDKKKAAKAPAPVIEPPAAPVDEPQEDEGALVAAITAAVALCMEEEPGRFRVVSFRKTTAKPAWNKK